MYLVKINRKAVKKVIFNHSKLRGKIVEVYKTNALFASDMGLSGQAISMKLNNKCDFTQSEIFKATELLSISPDDVAKYFFCLDS